MHEVLVNRLGGLSLPRKSVVRLTDHPDMTLDVYRGRKTTMQQYRNRYLCCGQSGYWVKLLLTEDYGFRPSSMDVDRGTTSLNVLKMHYFSVHFYIFLGANRF